MAASSIPKNSTLRDAVIEIEVCDHQSEIEVDTSLLASAARSVLQHEGIRAARLSIAVVDDGAIRQLNRRWLQHDYATDVLSFPLSAAGEPLEGEVVVSADTAAHAAAGYGWRTMDEMLLYVVHGTLHLVGYDDSTADARQSMRQRERLHLARYDLVPHYDDDPRAPQHNVGAGGRTRS